MKFKKSLYIMPVAAMFGFSCSEKKEIPNPRENNNAEIEPRLKLLEQKTNQLIDDQEAEAAKKRAESEGFTGKEIPTEKK